MTRESIIEKLRAEIERGIETEAQVSYFMAEVRKLLEQQNAKNQYEYLTFHCDWALHSRLDGRMAQKILRFFDAANVHLRDGNTKLYDLPPDQHREIEAISKMTYFERELERFLHANNLPSLDEEHPDGWVNFLHKYAMVVADSPLVVKSKSNSSTIKAVTLSVQLADRIVENETWFRVDWKIADKNGQFGTIFVINSMSLTQ